MTQNNFEDLNTLYNKVVRLIKKIDFSALWKGFKPIKFALYNSNECYFDGNYIERPNEFIANTAISYNGEIIAIWNLATEIDETVLTSKIVHEMFHGFQMKENESRFPNELDAIYEYKYLDENLSIKLEENKLIKQLFENFDINNFHYLLGLRKYRNNNFPYEFLYEAKIEQIEGTANYIELHALKQLSYELYLKKVNGMLNNIINPSNLLPIRIVSYDIGALLLTVLKSNSINIYEGFSDFTFTEDLIKNADDIVLKQNRTMSLFIKNYYYQAETIINNAVSNNDILENNKLRILGLNVYNAVYYDNYIISKQFIMYGEESNPTVKYGNFVIETKEKGFLSRIYRINPNK